ncbi:hypothetical protein N9I68_01820 [Bacteroidia bacterium]|nr:hypothetical protein [Bacteroidia bacterium]
MKEKGIYIIFILLVISACVKRDEIEQSNEEIRQITKPFISIGCLQLIKTFNALSGECS